MTAPVDTVAGAADARVWRETPLATVARMVAYETGVSAADIRGRSQLAGPVRARYAFCWLARALTVKSLSQIGWYLSDRDHSTIVHAVRRAERLRDGDPAFREFTARILVAFDRETKR